MKENDRQRKAGFREIEHTADWELEVWAPDLQGLLEQAAHGMYALAGVEFDNNSRCQRRFTLVADDAESLLVAFLNELLYFLEQERIAFDVFKIELQGFELEVDLGGARLLKMAKEIKAVTFHRLMVQTTPEGLRVNIVFDV